MAGAVAAAIDPRLALDTRASAADQFVRRAGKPVAAVHVGIARGVSPPAAAVAVALVVRMAAVGISRALIAGITTTATDKARPLGAGADAVAAISRMLALAGERYAADSVPACNAERAAAVGRPVGTRLSRFGTPLLTIQKFLPPEEQLVGVARNGVIQRGLILADAPQGCTVVPQCL